MIALIGSHGAVGQALTNRMAFDCVFNHDNIDTLLPNHFECVVIAAPSGNRLAVNRDPTQDKNDIEQITAAIKRSKPRRTILFSTVDSVVAPHTAYGANRRTLERNLVDVTELTIYRLSTLIGHTIKKNILYDIKHQQHLDAVDAGAWLQWCLLDDLARLVQWAQPGQIVDVVSEPIQNRELLERFKPNVDIKYAAHSVRYNQQPWCYSKQQIFEAMEQYLQ